MIRAFAALALPEAVRFDLMILQQGLPVPRLVAPESLHLTLVFLGDLPVRLLEDVDTAFRQLRAPGFALALAGLGLFGGPRPRVVYLGARANPALRHLQAKVETAARGAGVELPARRYLPHVTLARLPERFRTASGSNRRWRSAAPMRRRGSPSRIFACSVHASRPPGRPTRSWRAIRSAERRSPGNGPPELGVDVGAGDADVAQEVVVELLEVLPRPVAGVGGREEIEHAARRQARPGSADRALGGRRGHGHLHHRKLGIRGAFITVVDI